MTLQQFQSSLDNFNIKLNNFSNRIQVSYPNLAITITPKDDARVYNYVIQNQWVNLKSLSEGIINDLETKFTQIESYQLEINDLVNDLFVLKSDFRNHCPEPATRSSWTTVRQNMETTLLAEGIKQTVIDLVVDRIGNKGGLNAYNYLVKQIEAYARDLNFIFERHLSHYQFHKYSLGCANVNINSTINQNISYNVSTRLRNLKYSLEGRFSTIFRNIKLENKGFLRNNLNSLENWADTKLTSDVIPLLVHTQNIWNSNPSSFYSSGKKVMKATDLFHKVILHKSTAKYLTWMNNWHEEISFHEDLYKKKNNLIDEKIIWPGNLTKIKDIINSPSTYNNSDLIIRGKVKNINIRHLSQGKVLSDAEIHDSLGRVMKICIPYIKLDSGGIVEDSFIYVYGEFIISNPEANGDDAISIKRLSLSNLAKTNWEGWIRYIQRDIHEQIPHSLMCAFSSSFGSDGLINPAKYKITFKQPNLIKPLNTY